MMRRRRRGRSGTGTPAGSPGSDGGVDEPPPAPECPPGQRTGPPDFVGVGFQRCGTTRWFKLIASHPEVDQPPGVKEVHFFDRFHAGGFTGADADAYHAYFPRRDGQLVGEWTPFYASGPWIAPLLARAAPRARLLVLLRDPVERYLSGMQLNAEVARKRGAPLSRYAPLEAYARGLYHEQLTRMLRHFDRDRVLVMLYESCVADPAAGLRRTYSFLGLRDTDFVPDLSRHPRQQSEKPVLGDDARAALVEAYEPDVQALASAFPDLDMSLWPNFRALSPA